MTRNDANGPVPYQEALRLTAAAGIPQDNLRRLGPDLWEGTAEATGTVGSLVGPARKLIRLAAPAAYATAQLTCARHRNAGDHTYVVMRATADPEALVTRFAFGDVVDHDDIHFAGGYGTKRWFYVTTFAPLGVERAIAYLTDYDVLYVAPDAGCPPHGAPAGATANLLPITSTTATTSPATTTSTRVYPSYSYPPPEPCGIEVTAA
jgi:hypothetical protein